MQFARSSKAENPREVGSELTLVARADRRGVLTRFWPQMAIFQVGIEPIAPFLAHVQEWEAFCAKYSGQAKRVAKIEGLLRAGESLEPIYVEAGDPTNSIIEGKHRVVAFHRLGMKAIPVCRAHRA